MPVTVRYSAALDRTYEDGEMLGSPGGSGTESGSGASTPASLLMLSRTDSVDSLDADSVGSGSGNHSRQMSADSTEFIPTRTVKSSNAKPAFNPLQFVKTGKSRLVKTAELQIKQFEEVKKVKERVREDEEAWQSNLDNWKSKRRQISQKTIEKAEEMKQIEEIELDRQRKKSKTFNEMMEERSKRGTTSALPTYDLTASDLDEGGGGGTSDESVAAKGDVSFESCGSDHVFHAEDDRGRFVASSPVSNAVNHGNGRQDSNGGSGDSLKAANGHRASEEPEYTFDKAIQSYAQFAESRLRQPPANRNDERAARSPSAEDRLARESAVQHEEHVERACGQRMSMVVCLRRGGDNKEFGFSIKSVKGIGTGIFVENVHQHSPAESAGLRTNDEILSINGELCSSKRTHSAIVFAVKQAVYTGNLELEIYRYDDTEPIKKGFSMNSKSPTRMDRCSSETVLQNPRPPKVDLVKRRSVFENSSRTSPEKIHNRRSLDVSSKIKDRLANFENGDDSTAAAADFRKSPRRAAAFQQKLASFRSLDSLNSREPSGTDRAATAIAASSAVRDQEEAAGFRSRGLREFERTRSCERLDYEEGESAEDAAESGRFAAEVVRHAAEDGRFSAEPGQYAAEPDRCGLEIGRYAAESGRHAVEDGRYAAEPGMYAAETVRHVAEHGRYATESGRHAVEDGRYAAEPGMYAAETVRHAAEDGRYATESARYVAEDGRYAADSSDRQFEADLSELRMLVAMADDENPAAAAISHPTDLEAAETEDRHSSAKRLEEPLVSPHRDLYTPKSGFELAESLEETPITGSVPSSPREANSSGDMSIGFHQDPDDVTMGPLDPEDLTAQLENLELCGEVFVVDDVDPPVKTLEPPKEKPPPPPVDPADNGKKNQPDALKRVDSTKRIRTEIWKRRTDFLGIDGDDVQKLMQHEMESVTPPPTLENLLREDIFGHAWKDGGKSAEEDDDAANRECDIAAAAEDEKEITRKEREIIENLEWEERLMQNHEPRASVADEPPTVAQDFAANAVEEVEPQTFYPDTSLLKMREAELQRQEELLRLEKEKLRQEQEELLRQKEAYQKRIEDHQRVGVGAATVATAAQPAAVPQNVTATPKKDVRQTASPIYETISPPALLSPEGRTARGAGQPPPPPPTKPKIISPDFNDRIHSPSETADPSDKWPAHTRIADDHRPPALQPLTKQALSALSASPKVKLMDGDQWLARRKSGGQRRDNYNQHWLVQEAEFRRLHPQLQQQQPQDPEWQQGGYKSPQTNGNHAATQPPQPSASNGHAYSPGSQPQRQQQPPQLNHRPQPQHPAESHYAVPPSQQHRQPQSHFSPQQHQQPQERRQDSVSEAEPRPQTAIKAPPPPPHPPKPKSTTADASSASQMLSVSGKKKCSHCADELGRGAAMIIESLHLFYHINCFKCCVCHIQLGNGTSGADVRVRSQKLHCHNCYSNDEGLKFSKV